MTKHDFIEALWVKARQIRGGGRERMTRREVTKLLTIAFDEVAAAMGRGERFAWPGFGVFTVRTRKKRRIRSPVSNEMLMLDATKSVGFRASRNLKESLR